MDRNNDLKQIQIFAKIKPSSLNKVAAGCRQVEYEAGEVIMLEGDTNAPVCFVVQGTVRVFSANSDGREQTLTYLSPGASFNLPPAFSDHPAAQANAMAVTGVKLLAISPQDFRRITGEEPDIAMAVLHDFSNRLHHFARLTHDLSLRSVRSRLARLLLSRAQGENEALTRWTQEEIASQIGTVREVVSRTLRAFAREGLIDMQRQRIVLLDPDGLEDEAGL